MCDGNCMCEKSDDFEYELAHAYLKYEFNLKKLIGHIGIDEVQRVLDEMKSEDA